MVGPEDVALIAGVLVGVMAAGMVCVLLICRAQDRRDERLIRAFRGRVS